MAEPLLTVSGVSKRFGALQALEDVSLRVAGASFHGLIGPNGSGKSTLLKVIAGAHFVDSGRIVLAGRDITRAAPYERARQGLSLKFQITAVLQELSVYDNVLLAFQSAQPVFALLGSTSRRTSEASVMTMLGRFRLADRADDLAGELSHGEQQWLEIAMALAPKPRLLLLDEPTGGMSPEERRATGELLLPIKSECALVIVEHDLDFIKNICDRLTVLDQGRVLDNGTVAESNARRASRRSMSAACVPILAVDRLSAGYGRSQMLFALSLIVPRAIGIGIRAAGGGVRAGNPREEQCAWVLEKQGGLGRAGRRPLTTG